jgi:hypothetical protein
MAQTGQLTTKDVMTKEIDIYQQLARYMNLKHPKVIYHFDGPGINNASIYSRSL